MPCFRAKTPSRRYLSAVVLVVGLVTALGPPSALGEDGAEPAPMVGFTADGAAAQRALEARLDELVEPQNLKRWMERLAARPHHLGSAADRENVELMAELFRSWGYQTEIETFHVPFPVPSARSVELLEPERFTASLTEPPVDGAAGEPAYGAEQLPLYNAYSAAGDVTGELVYVNYGVPDDYEELERRGIDVDGKVVIARYGGSWRGIKPKVAAEHGAVGCLLYSDPRDDGYFRGDPYPEGGYRNRDSGQRGSVMDMPRYPGDPTTPGRGSVEGVERIPLDEVETLTAIPVLPISWADAEPLLAALGGPVAPEPWRGALPFTYHLGPGPATVRLALDFEWRTTPVHDVIARWPGAELPDQWVIRGNHHDAWVAGATDPISGMVAVLEEARVVAELARAGHPPRRTVIYAGWGGEEQGLLGSTEWAETHADELREKAVAYVNTDSSSRGFLGAGGSHSLERLVNQVAREVTDPDTGESVAERRRALLSVMGSDEDRKDLRDRIDLRISALGSGSDYSPFLQHLGIASLNLGYGGHGDYGVYHSAYDSVDHYQRFMDPDYSYGAALVSTAGRITLRLANAAVVPLRFGNATETYSGYVDEVIALADTMRAETEAHNRRLDEGAWELVADPRETLLPPPRRDPVPYLSFAPLQNAAAELDRAASRYDAAADAVAGHQGPLGPQAREALERADALLRGAERALTREEGLPQRPWYVHHVYAPGFYTGYGVKTLPTVREAIEERQWALAEEQIGATAEVLRAYAERVARAAELLEQAVPSGSTAAAERSSAAGS